MDLTPPDEHQLLVFWVGLLVLVTTARLLGAMFRRIGQPAVIGELGAGLLLGPSVLGRLAPDVTEWLFPADDVQTAMLFTVGWLGVLLLLVSTGYETDLGLIRRLGRAAVIVSTFSLLVPIALGVTTGGLMPDRFIGENDDRAVFALFMGVALAISSLPVIAKVLTEMGFLRRNVGQLTLAAGMANDVIGWVLLGVIVGITQAGSVDVSDLTVKLLGIAAVFVFAFTAGRRVIDELLRTARSSSNPQLAATTVVVIVALTGGAVTQWLGVEAVLGAFVAGMALGRSRFRDDRVMHNIESITASFFAPVFFATAGLRVDLGQLADATVLVWAVVVLAVASASKFFGALAGASIAGLPRREGYALGVGLNARGALEIVIAAVGLSLGVLNDASYAIVVLMAMATSMAAPPLLRAALHGWPGTDEERLRLEREATMRSNVLVRGGQLLVPSRGRLDSIMAAELADLAWPTEVGVTVLSVGAGGERPDITPLRNVLADRVVEHRVVRHVDPVAAILEESRLGYSAIVLGATEVDGSLSETVRRVLAGAQVPVVIVRRAPLPDLHLPWAYSRAVVPVSGGRSSRAAQELAMTVSSRIGTELHLVHVLRRPDEADRSLAGARLPTVGALRRDTPRVVGRRLLDAATTAATAAGARVVTHMRSGGDTAEALLDSVAELEADLVVLATSRRELADAPYLGGTVEQILSSSRSAVVVAVLPPAPSGS